MTELPKISILIPAKNAVKTLHIAIEDATQQAGVDWQILIANDGSTDGTLDLIKEYQQHFNGIEVIDVPKPGGIVAGRNLLLERVNTPYLAWLDSDDGWPRADKLKGQIEFLQNNPEHALVGDGKVRGVFLEDLRQKNFRYPLKNEDIQLRLLFKNAFIMSSIVARTDMVKSIRFNPDMEYLEDYVWVQQVASGYKVANMVLGGTLHFISSAKEQDGKDQRYDVYAKEAILLEQSLAKVNCKLSSENAAFLADFVRRNRPLTSEGSTELKQIIRQVTADLIALGYKKSIVNGFFWDVQLRRLKCRWLLKH